MICDKCGAEKINVVIDVLNANLGRWERKHLCGLECARKYLDEDCEGV